MYQRLLALSLALAGWSLAAGVAPGQSSSADSARIEGPGPCSRRTPLVISEIHFHPLPRPDSNNLEFIELYNSQPWAEDLGGFRLAGAAQFTFPAGTVLAGEGVLVVATDPSAIREVYGITNVTGPLGGRLNNDSEQVRLVSHSGAVLLEAAYSGKPPWPVAADGGGHSLVLARPSLGEQHPAAWAASDRIGGSPGQLKTPDIEPLREVMFNEILAHSTPPHLDFLELHHSGPAPADLSGCHLTDDPTTNKFTFADGTMLAPGGFLALSESELNFALHAAGETLYLIHRNGTRILDAVRYGGQGRDESFGRFPDGSPWWSVLSNRSAGLPNHPPAVRDMVINEILYAPPSRRDADQFIELHNRGNNVVNLSGWRFVDGIEFTFPTNTTLEPGSHLAVGRDLTRLRTNHPGVPAARLIGNFSGNLADRGERIALARPETVVSTNLGVVQTNTHFHVVDEVTYGTGGRWPAWANKGGSSLERIDARDDGRLATAWGGSDETAKANWTTVVSTGRLDHGDGSSANALQIVLLGAGECLIDDVEVIGSAGQNLLANPSFESGLTPWTMQGDHEASSLQPNGGVNDSPCLHLRAGGDGDPGANRIRVPLTSALPVNSEATLRAKVRWLRGPPEILLRLTGNYLEAFGTLSVPAGLGTPGAPNSRAVANAGPGITAMRHEPILPAANQAVLVTGRLQDLDGLSQALLKYRIDPNTNNVFTVPLVDDGSGGDSAAGDGLFSAVIPGQPAGTLVAFHLQATDAHAAPATHTFPSDAPARECLVRFGETPSSGRFNDYRLWVTQATFNRWASRLKLSNAGLDATFVSGTNRVIYNVQALYAGSAYHASRYTTPTGVACDYKIVFPADDPFLGGDEATVVWPGLTGGDPVDTTAQQEQTSYWVGSSLGLPFNYQRYVHFFLNGVRRSFIMQDTQKPDRDSIRQWFPDNADGELFKVQIWREYDAAANNTSSTGATLGNFTTVDGVKKTARYRWTWTPRATGITANTFSNLFELVDVVNSSSNTYTAAVESVIDIEQWMRTFATEHLVGNWDSYGYGNGQNMYAYKPEGDRWKLMIWDMDVCLGNASDPPTADLFKLTNPYFASLNGDPAVVGRMYNHPKFARAYWRAIQDAVQGPLAATNLHPYLDAKAAALAANGVAVASTAGIKNFLGLRRDYCLGRLATVAAPFALDPGAVLVASNNPVVISGTAPVEVRDILINGVPVPVTWTSVTSWTARVTLIAGTNVLVVQGLDRLGNSLESARTTHLVEYVGPPLPHVTVVINEWMASNTSPEGFPNPAGDAYDDWFELHNPGPDPADLTGHYLTDNLAARFQYSIPAGYTVPPGGYLVVWADGDPSRNHTNQDDLHVSFQLSRNGEAIALSAPGGTLIDSVTFGPQTNNVSQGRWPDADADVQFMTSPTPGSANVWRGLTNAPAFTQVILEPDGGLALTWKSIAGKSYRLESKNALDATTWAAVGSDHLANSSRSTRIVPMAPPGSRFYRVRQLD